MNWAKIKQYINIIFSWDENKPVIRIVIPLLKVGLSINFFIVK